MLLEMYYLEKEKQNKYGSCLYFKCWLIKFELVMSASSCKGLQYVQYVCSYVYINKVPRSSARSIIIFLKKCYFLISWSEKNNWTVPTKWRFTGFFTILKLVVADSQIYLVGATEIQTFYIYYALLFFFFYNACVVMVFFIYMKWIDLCKF